MKPGMIASGMIVIETTVIETTVIAMTGMIACGWTAMVGSTTGPSPTAAKPGWTEIDLWEIARAVIDLGVLVRRVAVAPVKVTGEPPMGATVKVALGKVGGVTTATVRGPKGFAPPLRERRRRVTKARG
jgi:membrane-bound ClpP family serine protease